MYFVFIVYSQLISFSVHLGHTMKNTLLFAAWFVHKFKSNLAFINLFKFIFFYNLSMLFVVAAVGSQSPIWFVNLDQSVDLYVRFCAYNCGEFSVTTGWIGGLASNLSSILNGYLKMLTLPGFLKTTKKLRVDRIFEEFVLSRYTWPRCIFFSNVHDSVWACKDALYGQVPAIGIVDTNTFSHIATSAVPGSDDSFRTITFTNDLIASIILSRKFFTITHWFFFNKNPRRFLDFSTWIESRYKTANLSVFRPVVSAMGEKPYILSKGMEVLASYGSSVKGFKESFDIFAYNFYSKSRFFIYYNSINYRNKLSLLMMSAFFRGHDTVAGFFRKKFFSFSSLKLNFFIKFKNKYIFLHGYRIVNSFLKRFFKYHWKARDVDSTMNDFLIELSTVMVYNGFRQFKIINKGSFITGLLFNDYLKDIMQDLFAFTKPKISLFYEKIYVASKSFRFWKSFAFGNSVKRYLNKAVNEFDFHSSLINTAHNSFAIRRPRICSREKFFIGRWMFSRTLTPRLLNWNYDFYKLDFDQIPNLFRDYFYFYKGYFNSLSNIPFQIYTHNFFRLYFLTRSPRNLALLNKRAHRVNGFSVFRVVPLLINHYFQFNTSSFNFFWF